ncbi:MAG: prepilin-type N-terminal cleavage/methylation domain-containing protein [Candidatus Riflebacteria bacterium]|nr:prepilin-type N-terminal cleavage/methylation domain-containing protein [Candidatus Riflebacteria bacterium]
MIGKTKQGFSLMEMLIVVAILAIISSASIPLAEISYSNNKEEELLASLESMREAIKLWRRDCRNAVVAQYGYNNLDKVPYYNLCPPSLEALVFCRKDDDGHYYTNSRPEPVDVIKDKDGNIAATFIPRKYLDRIPEDPFVGRACWLVHVASGTCLAAYNFREANTTRSYKDEDFTKGNTGAIDPHYPDWKGVFDVSCIPSYAVDANDYFTRRGYNISVDGTKYEDW